MKILDILIYYLTHWFTIKNQKSNWSTPLERAVNAVGLCTILWLISLGELIEIFIFKSNVSETPLIPGTIAGLCITQLYSYIYIKKKRYELISSYEQKPLPLDNNIGIRICIIFGLLSFVAPYLIFLIFG